MVYIILFILNIGRYMVIIKFLIMIFSIVIIIGLSKFVSLLIILLILVL